MIAQDVFNLAAFGIVIVLLGTILRHASDMNSIMSGFSSAYANIAGALEHAG